MAKLVKTDFLVIGSGLAGLAFALKTANSHSKITLITKDKAPSANTSWAQGGIAAVMSKEDSFESHIRDTLRAGAGLCNESVVRNYVEQAPDRIKDLMNWGVNFDYSKDGQNLDLTREGAHSARRVVHVEDHTGGAIHQALLNLCLKHPHIEVLENHFGIDLIVNKQVDPQDMGPTACVGAYVLDRVTGEVKTYLAKSTILSTGGAGKVYLYTSNWSGATGDGIAMAYRAGARVANLEFMQFHPTCLYHRESRNFLISEALRGEGGELINAKGEAFMKKYHELGSLAPRDVVARSIDAEMKKTGEACVFLDMKKHNREFLRERFPVIFEKCMEFGIDMSVQPIPVVPAAHYLCGGVITDKNGQSDIENLWVLGESACTGLHGANRLASNSLLECLAMAHNCSALLLDNYSNLSITSSTPADWRYPSESNADEMIVITHMWDEIRTLMWNYVGIVRSNKRLERASNRLENILGEVREYYSNFKIHSDIIELRNIAIVAKLTVECARRRQESRGIHFSLDYKSVGPEASSGVVDKSASDTILVRGF
jgi:L-aspartate oxidase